MGWRYLNLTLVFLSLAGASWSQSGPGQPAGGPHSSQPQPQPGGAVRRHRMGAIVGWRDWRRNDPTVFNSLWKSKTPLGNAELYIVLALLIGLVTVVIGCWLSDNCWSPEPEQLTTLA